MGENDKTNEDSWGFDATELHEDDLRYGYVIPTGVSTASTQVKKPAVTKKATTAVTTTKKAAPPKKKNYPHVTSNYSHYSGTGYSTGGGYQRHKHDGEPAFRIGRVFIGGGSDSGRHAKKADVLVDCTNGKFEHKPPKQKKPVWGGIFSGLNQFMSPPSKEPEIIGLHWPDGGKPPVPLAFFKEIVEICQKRAKEEDRDISLVFACMGGHGRTGTALAAVLVACKEYTAADAIEYVREHHCYKACETAVQLEWLCDRAGFGEKTSDSGFPLHSYAAQYKGAHSGHTGSGGTAGFKSNQNKASKQPKKSKKQKKKAKKAKAKAKAKSKNDNNKPKEVARTAAKAKAKSSGRLPLT